MPSIDLNFRFSSPKAEEIFFCNKRNMAVNGGFGSGKTYVVCQKALAMLCKFPGYRIAIGRYSGVDLKKTTMQTFFKICPASLYDPAYGGKKVDAPIPYLDLVNGSRIYWMHFDEHDETSLRSLEINMAIIDQAEEVQETTYIELDNRVGRWDEVTVPDDLLSEYPNWPRNEFTGKPMAPSFHIIVCNPPDEGEFSYIYQRFHPDSDEFKQRYHRDHQYFELASFENAALPRENLEVLQSRDPEWQERFVYGKFGRGEGAIHNVSPLSILDVDDEWIKENLLKKGALSRVLDHGASAPTCCTWWASIRGLYFGYREYYQPDDIVSVHRRRIAELSHGETYVSNYADPAIFKKQSEKYGGFWTTADEYRDSSIGEDPIFWSPADNNEFATRNRINELLRLNPSVSHPISGKFGAPRIYFCRRSEGNSFGLVHTIKQLASQKKKLLAEINGKKVYSDERDEGLEDHAYDTVRYFCASHLGILKEPKVKPKPNSFLAARNRIKALKILQENQY